MLRKVTSSNSERLYWLCLYTIHGNIYCVYVESHTDWAICCSTTCLGVFPFNVTNQLPTATQWKASYLNARSRLSFIPYHKLIDILETRGRSSLCFTLRPLKVSTDKHQRMCQFLLFMNILPIQIYLFYMSFWFWVTVLSLRLFCLTAKEMAYTKVQLSLTPETSLGISPEQAPILQMLFGRIARQHGVSCLAAACFQNAKTNM